MTSSSTPTNDDFRSKDKKRYDEMSNNMLDMFNQAFTNSFTGTNPFMPPTFPQTQDQLILQDVMRKVESLQKENNMLRENQEIFVNILNSVLAEIRGLGLNQEKLIPIYENIINVLTKGFADSQKTSTSKLV